VSKKFLKIVFLFLVACSDGDGISSNQEEKGGLSNLHKCTLMNEGVTIKEPDGDLFYTCSKGKWEKIDNPVSSSSFADSENDLNEGQSLLSSSSSFANSEGGLNESQLTSSSLEFWKKLSSDSMFENKGTLRDPRDGQVYRTVTIGEQVWMAENLNYAYPESTAKLESSSFCYKYEPDSCAKYGRLYTWGAASDSAGLFFDKKNLGAENGVSLPHISQGVCPEGWHIPSKDEWLTLLYRVGGDYISLMSKEGWSGLGSDAFGFSALPGKITGKYSYLSDVTTLFWGKDSYREEEVQLILVDSTRWPSKSEVVSGRQISELGYVRCLRNLLLPLSSSTGKGTLVDKRDGKVYKTVKIGSQTWMAENLDYSDDNLYKIVFSGDWGASQSIGKVTCLHNREFFCKQFGTLYSWSRALDSAALWSEKGKGCTSYQGSWKCDERERPVSPLRGVCPEGWHLPDSLEWEKLFDFVGGGDVAGRALKAQWSWIPIGGENGSLTSGNGYDSFGFEALAGGTENAGDFLTDGKFTAFVSVTTRRSSCVRLNYDSDGYERRSDSRCYVRCIKD